MEPVEERPGGLRYRSGSGFFALFESAGEASGSHTQIGWGVVDIEATVAALKSRGVVFGEYAGNWRELQKRAAREGAPIDVLFLDAGGK